MSDLFIRAHDEDINNDVAILLMLTMLLPHCSHWRPIFFVPDYIPRVTTSTVPTNIPIVDPDTDSSFIDTFATWYTAATVTKFFSQVFSPILSQDV